MIFVDSAYLFALADDHDELHPRAMNWATTVPPPLLTTEYVLWEMVNGFSKIVDRPKAHALLASMEHSPAWEIISAQGNLYAAGMTMHRQCHDKDWSLTDCISFIVMRERCIQRALTHDHHFEQAGFEALLRRDPP